VRGMDLKITTWNINSVRLRQGLVADFLKEHSPDILALQEIKCQNDQFPYAPFRELGYEYIEVAGMKGYHGAATLSRIPLERLSTNFCPLDHARHVSTKVKTPGRDFELHNFYIPAGGDVADPVINDKFRHKLDFLATMNDYFSERASVGDEGQVLVGDFNIAPGEHDVWSHKQLLKVVSHTPIEVETLEKLRLSHDFIDTSRLFRDPEEKLFSWWSYRARDVMASNRGRRLDHVWVSPVLEAAARKAGRDGYEIHTEWRVKEKPSDHVPVTQTLSF